MSHETGHYWKIYLTHHGFQTFKLIFRNNFLTVLDKHDNLTEHVLDLAPFMSV